MQAEGRLKDACMHAAWAVQALLGALSGVLKEAFQMEPGCLSVKAR